MKRCRLGLGLLSIVLSLFLGCGADEGYHIPKQRAAKQITGRIEELGGYFIVQSNDLVTVRVPAEHTGRLRSFLQSVADEIIEYSPQATDLRDELFAVRSGIESREEILQKNLEYIDKADVAGTLEIEKEIMDLLSEIEELKGRERRLVTDIEYALSPCFAPV